VTGGRRKKIGSMVLSNTYSVVSAQMKKRSPRRVIMPSPQHTTMRKGAQSAKVRARIAAAVERLPEGKAVPSGEHLSLEVRKRRFGWFMADHHGDGRLCINCKVPALIAAQLESSVPAQFHIPKYVGAKGWIGLWLDVPGVDWVQVEACLQEAYRLTAPKTLLRELEA